MKLLAIFANDAGNNAILSGSTIRYEERLPTEIEKYGTPL
jgi:hypothetical protein